MPRSASRRPSGRTARGTLNAETIVAAAFEVAARCSIDELSIPLVAKSLGVGVTSVYWHVPNKEELLDAMTDVALERSELPAFVASSDWRESMMAKARTTRRALLGNPVLTDLILIRGTLGPTSRELREREMEMAVATMVAGGLDRQQALDLLSAVSLLVRGSVLAQRLEDKRDAGGDVSPDAGPTRAAHDRAFELLLTTLFAAGAGSK